jgi:hypothetical protein
VPAAEHLVVNQTYKHSCSHGVPIPVGGQRIKQMNKHSFSSWLVLKKSKMRSDEGADFACQGKSLCCDVLVRQVQSEGSTVGG